MLISYEVWSHYNPDYAGGIMRKLFILLLMIGFCTASSIAGTLTGKVTAEANGEPLSGANIYLKGTTVGAATDDEGTYYIRVDDGTYEVVCDYVGYAPVIMQVDIFGDTKINFVLTESLFAKAIDVIADRARDRETPVAYTDIDKNELVNSLGSQDIPMVLNVVPSVYATMNGGGAGDARINVRGFNQNNIAIMINGVPINDMENGWVYWSNWDGLSDASQSIQMQRGLTAVNLATPSIGGTMNIITDPAASNMGFTLKQEIGSGSFLKTIFTAASGLINDKFALNATLLKKTGDGIVNGTWADTWAYYFGVAYNVNSQNRLEFYAVGAPQRHGQNLNRQNIAVYSHEYAMNLNDYSPAALSVFKESTDGRLYNQNWSQVSSNYKGKQSAGDKTFDRYNKHYLNEKENFYHKPQINFNWYSTITQNLGLSSILYYSGGVGGGSGFAGRIYRRDANDVLGNEDWNYSSGPAPYSIDFNSTINMNAGPAGSYFIDQVPFTKQDGQSIGILRNSRNNQYTIGLISKLNWKPTANLSTSMGIDWRSAEIEHYYEVRDLLGGEYYIPDSDQRSDFWGDNEMRLELGDKFNYYNTNTVDWIGGFLQAEYTMAEWTAYTTFGLSQAKYTYLDHFKTADTLTALTAPDPSQIGNPDLNSGEFKLESDPQYGFQIKGGAMYRVTPSGDVYTNIGYVEKVPIFDNVIDDNNGVFAGDAKPEKFTSFEVGTNWKLLEDELTLKGNFYYTLWQDRALPRSVQTGDDQWDILFLTGLDQLHMGFEFEGAYQPMPVFRFDLAGSIGNWKLVSDAKGHYRSVDSGILSTTEYLVGVDGLKIGDSPQTQIAISGTVFPEKNARLQLAYRYYANYYADWDPTSRIVFDGAAPDRTQSWKVPSYGLLEFHGSYTLPSKPAGINFTIFVHIFNILDKLYISDAVDNSLYNGFDEDHDADDSEVYMGLPRRFNLGLTISY